MREREPGEHIRFAAYLDQLGRVPGTEEVGLVRLVLNDADQTMAQSAVVRHLDRRAAELLCDAAYANWVESMTEVVIGYAFLIRRLDEWSLFRALTLDLPWRRENLLTASNWLQLKVATESSGRAVEVLAGAGRTKRIRGVASTGLGRASTR